MTKTTIYTVQAYRWGDKEMHSYTVGVYTDKKSALDAAKATTEWRAGKYECEVLEWVADTSHENGKPGMGFNIVKGLS